MLDQLASTYLHLAKPPKSLNHSRVKNRLFCGRPGEGEGRMRGCPHPKTDPALFMSITKFSRENPVYNSIHLLGTAVLGKGDIFGSNSRDA